MSNPKTIEEILDELVLQVLEDNHQTVNGITTSKQEALADLSTIVRDAMGDMEHQETEDMSLNSWTPEDYKAFGRNELRVQIINKLFKEK